MVFPSHSASWQSSVLLWMVPCGTAWPDPPLGICEYYKPSLWWQLSPDLLILLNHQSPISILYFKTDTILGEFLKMFPVLINHWKRGHAHLDTTVSLSVTQLLLDIYPPGFPSSVHLISPILIASIWVLPTPLYFRLLTDHHLVSLFWSAASSFLLSGFCPWSVQMAPDPQSLSWPSHLGCRPSLLWTATLTFFKFNRILNLLF